MYFDIEDQIENNFTKVDRLMRFVKGRRILIAVDSKDRRCGTKLKQTLQVERWKNT
jgi:hypothetical protein